MKFPKLNDQYLVSACVLSHFSRVELFATPWTIAGQPPLSMGFSKQEYWSELPCTLPGDLPDPGIEPASLMSPALADKFFTTAAAAKSLSRVRLLATPWTAAFQAPPSMGGWGKYFQARVLASGAIVFSTLDQNLASVHFFKGAPNPRKSKYNKQSIKIQHIRAKIEWKSTGEVPNPTPGT